MDVITIPELIKKKRDGIELNKEEINYFINAVVNKTIQDTQIGAMLMAIFLKGMSIEETTNLTQSMTMSGDVTIFPPLWEDIIVDKHSTGGVGDKISLILAPALAACGLKVPMVSGRGLAFTGGTLDKLESIPGFRINLSKEDMIASLEDAGCFIAGATSKLAPADGVLYQHRDITNTVDCLPLIASSILSKKAAEGTKALVMDIKVGKGTFMKTVEQARKLVNVMMDVGNGLGVKTKAVLSKMDIPIGHCIGNAIEVEESVECLRGNVKGDLSVLVETLGGVLLQITGRCANLKEGQKRIREVVENGLALNHFQTMLTNQGVPAETAQDLCNGNYLKVLPQAPQMTKVYATETGYVHDINALEIAIICWHLGAGRNKASDSIDHRVGIRLLKHVGDAVGKSEPILIVYHTTEKLSEQFYQQLVECYQIKENVANTSNRIIEII